jgi:thiol-disulfide isomerase/thioredoxin
MPPCVALFGLFLILGIVAPARAADDRRLTTHEQQSVITLFSQRALCGDPATADSVYAALGQALATEPDSLVRAYMYRNRFEAARALDHPDSMIMAADSAVALLPFDQSVLQELANYLAARGLRLEVAESSARRAVARYGPEQPEDRARALASLGYVESVRGNFAAAVPTFTEMLQRSRTNSQWGLYYLGRAFERTGRPERAADAWIRSAATWRGDTSLARRAAQSLDSLPLGPGWQGKELEKRIASARLTARREELLESRRDGRDVGSLRLFDLRGGTYRTLDLNHGVTVLDVWGTWCGPCREALPGLRAFASRHAREPVRFVMLSIERDGVEESSPRVLRALDSNGLMMPAFGGDSVAVTRLAVSSYPTTLVIRNGRIAYRNIGVSDEALDAQIADLISVTPRPAKARSAGSGGGKPCAP